MPPVPPPLKTHLVQDEHQLKILEANETSHMISWEGAFFPTAF
jgi:hypothetical protein